MKQNRALVVLSTIIGMCVGNASVLQAMEQSTKESFAQKLRNYKSFAITPEILSVFQCFSINDPVTKEWFDSPEVQAILKILARGGNDIFQITTRYNANQAFLGANDFRQCSFPHDNYTLLVPSTYPWKVCRIAGHHLRAGNALEELGLYCKPQEHQARKDDLNKVLAGHTYQTVSIAANHLRLAQIIQEKKLKYIQQPQVMLVPLHSIDGSTSVSDNTHVIIQDSPGMNVWPLRLAVANQEFLDALIENGTMLELYEALKSTGLWQIDQSAFTDGTHIYFYDLQQASKTAPKDFYNKHTDKAIFTISCGLGRLAKFFAPNSIHRTILVNCIENDAELPAEIRTQLIDTVKNA